MALDQEKFGLGFRVTATQDEEEMRPCSLLFFSAVRVSVRMRECALECVCVCMQRCACVSEVFWQTDRLCMRLRCVCVRA
jgi:hypothetical protein